MKWDFRLKMILSAFLVVWISSSALVGCATPVNAAKLDELTLQETKTALKNAYIYTLPLAMVNATREKMLLLAPSNTLVHTKKLSDSDTRIVVTPNVDTLYSQAFLNLSKEEAMVLEKPAAERYYMIQVMNAYTDNIQILGTGADGQDANTYLFTRKDYKGKVPPGMMHIKVDTDMVWILIRIVCADAADYPNVYALQEKTKLMPLENYLSGEPYVPEPEESPHDSSFVPIQYVMSLPAKAYFDIANQLMVNNPPKVQDKAMMRELAKVNVGPGLVFDDSILGENKAAFWQQIKAEANLAAAQETLGFNTSNGAWSYFDKPIGDYGTEYGYRAMVSLRGLAANPIDSAVYAKTTVDGAGNPLNGSNQYKIHFEKDALPPVEDFGFWSITVYGQDDFLIANEENKYAITDRTPFVKNADGSLDLYVSMEVPQNVDPANWLPVLPADFHLFLRIYVPSKDVAKGKWSTPTIEKME